MKFNKPKKYQYNCQLVDAWLTNQLPPEGGFYKGSSTHLECDATHFWAGEDQAFLLATKHPKALLLSPVADIPFTGAVCDSSRMVAASYAQNRTIRFLLPKHERKKHWEMYRQEKRPPIGIPTLFVPRLREEMCNMFLEMLLPSVYKYYDRAFQKHFAAREHGAHAHLLGYYAWDNYRDPNKHATAVSLVRRSFDALNIPFKEEWNQMALLRTAKKRLAA
jgi:hypothetical protein